MENIKTSQKSADLIVKEITEEVYNFIAPYNNFTITTPSEYEKSSFLIKKLREKVRQIEKKRKDFTQPLLDLKRKWDNLFKKPITILEDIISKINQEMFAYRRKQEEEARKKKEEMEKQAEGDDLFVPEVKPEIPKTEVKVRKIWKFRIKDKTKIKMDFLVPDEKTIGELVRKLKDKAVNIVGEGIEVYYEEVSY